MSKSSDRAAGAALLAALGMGLVAPWHAALAQPAASTAESIRALQGLGKEADKGKPGSAARDAAVTALAPRAAKRPLLRCWQYGKLIYEGSGVTAAVAPAGAAPIELRNGNAVAMQLFDLKSGLCLLDLAAD